MLNHKFSRAVILLTFVLPVISISGFKNKPGTKNINEVWNSRPVFIDTPVQQLKVTLPKNAKLIDGKPVGKNWINLLSSLEGWNADMNYWSLANNELHGDYPGGKLHNYAWTKKQYKDFELHAVVRLDGKEANSGVCIRLQPVDADNAPGYQVDMGPGYWGCLWEEKRAGMVQKFPEELADKLVKAKDWNHYYVIARGHHIQAWLNGVKTIDTIHISGFEEGAIGFQLCHGDKHTILDVKSLYIKEIK
ncbi:MAG: DUF1080 domain-containing protein [Chitinophagaceae bacterium]